MKSYSGKPTRKTMEKLSTFYRTDRYGFLTGKDTARLDI
jgi:hypothetical protein